MLGKRFRNCFWLLCIFSLVSMVGSPAFAKSKKAKAKPHANHQAISSIWKGQGEEVEILHFGDGGLFWSLENEDYDEEIYHFDGSRVEQMEDMRGYEFEHVERDGIQVWVESLDDYWGEFRLFYKMDGKKKVVKDFYEHIPTNIQINYPYITWQEQRNGIHTACSFNVETEELRSDSDFGTLEKSLFKKDQQDRNEIIRSLEINEYEYGKHQDWVNTKDYFVWSERTGVFLTDSHTDSRVYKLTNDLQTSDLLGADDHFTVWEDNEGIGVYSKDDDQVSLLTGIDELDEIASAKVANGQAAIAVEEDEMVEIYLIKVAELLSTTTPESREEYKPQVIKPKFVEPIQGLLTAGTDFMESSSEYFVWTENSWTTELKYKKLKDSKTYVIPGEWASAVVRGNIVYALGNEGREDEYGDWYFPSSRFGLYQIDLETGKLEHLLKIDTFSIDDLDELVEQSEILYWYDYEEEAFVSYDLVSEESNLLDLDVYDPTAFAVDGETFVWIDNQNGKQQIIMQTIGEEPVTVAEWSTKDKYANEVRFDGKRIVWNEKKKNSSNVILYDVEKRQTKTIFSAKDERMARHLEMDNNAIYFVGPKSKSSMLLQRYDLTTGKTIVHGNNVHNYTVQGDKVYYADERHEDLIYLVGKKVKSSKGISLRYKWKELSRNNQQKWYDLQYSFFPQDIHVKIRDVQYTWDELLDSPYIWNRAVKEEPENIEVSISL